MKHLQQETGGLNNNRVIVPLPSFSGLTEFSLSKRNFRKDENV